MTICKYGYIQPRCILDPLRQISKSAAKPTIEMAESYSWENLQLLRPPKGWSLLMMTGNSVLLRLATGARFFWQFFLAKNMFDELLVRAQKRNIINIGF